MRLGVCRCVREDSERVPVVITLLLRKASNEGHRSLHLEPLRYVKNLFRTLRIEIFVDYPLHPPRSRLNPKEDASATASSHQRQKLFIHAVGTRAAVPRESIACSEHLVADRDHTLPVDRKHIVHQLEVANAANLQDISHLLQ